MSRCGAQYQNPFPFGDMLNPEQLGRSLREAGIDIDSFFGGQASGQANNCSQWKKLFEQFTGIDANGSKAKKSTKEKVSTNDGKFQVLLDVEGFKPEDIAIKIVDGFVII